MNLREGGPIVKAAFVLVVGCGGLLALAIVSFICAGIGLIISVVFKDMTPGKLALLSLAIGVLPLGIAMLGAGLARISGGQVDARGASGCILFGWDLNSLVSTVYDPLVGHVDRRFGGVWTDRQRHLGHLLIG